MHKHVQFITLAYNIAADQINKFNIHIHNNTHIIFRTIDRNITEDKIQ